jgi:hypothetical protein
MKEDGISRTIAFLDSIHAGSKYAVWPPNFHTKAGNPMGQNQAQVKLWDYWRTFWDECDRVGVDTVVVMGEYIDGMNEAEKGDDELSTNLTEQKRGAIDLFTPHLKDRKLFGLTGSSYHVRAGTLSMDEEITEELGGQHCGYILNCTFAPSQKVFNISHFHSETFYKATALSREMAQMKEAEGTHALPMEHVDVVVRGHIHSSLVIHEHHIHGFLVPGWKIYHPIKGRVQYYGRRVPMIGGVIVRITDDDRLRIWPELYPTPHLLGLLNQA